MEISDETSVISSRHGDKRLVSFHPDERYEILASAVGRATFSRLVSLRAFGREVRKILDARDLDRRCNAAPHVRHCVHPFFFITTGNVYLLAFSLFPFRPFSIIPTAWRFVANVPISLSPARENISNKPPRYVHFQSVVYGAFADNYCSFRRITMELTAGVSSFCARKCVIGLSPAVAVQFSEGRGDDFFFISFLLNLWV